MIDLDERNLALLRRGLDLVRHELAEWCDTDRVGHPGIANLAQENRTRVDALLAELREPGPHQLIFTVRPPREDS